MSALVLILFLAFFWLVVLKLVPFWKKPRRTKTVGLNVVQCLSNISNLIPTIHHFVQKNKLYKGFYHAWLGVDFTLLTADADCAQWILMNKDFVKAIPAGIPESFAKKFTKHLVFSSGEVWKKQRSVVNGGFVTEAYKSYYPTFNHITERYLSVLSALPPGDVDISKYSSKFTLDLLGKSIFHYDFKNLESDENEYYQAYQAIIQGGPFARLPGQIIPFYDRLPIPKVKRMHRCYQVIAELFGKVIEEHRKNGNVYGDILDKLLHSEEEHKLTEVELFSNVWVFFVAGHETTSSALSWCFAELADKQDIQEKLYRTILDSYPPGVPSLDSVLSPPPYLDYFIKENLRQHPPVPVIPTRKAPFDMKCGDQLIPAGTRVGVDVRSIHYSPEYWDHPELFDPERFSPERRKGHHKFSFLPFSLGQRKCIGADFSEIEQRLFLARFLREFKVLPPQDHEKTELTQLTEIGKHVPIYVRIQKRD